MVKLKYNILHIIVGTGFTKPGYIKGYNSSIFTISQEDTTGCIFTWLNTAPQVVATLARKVPQVSLTPMVGINCSH